MDGSAPAGPRHRGRTAPHRRRDCPAARLVSPRGSGLASRAVPGRGAAAMMTCLEAAREYLCQGLHPIPCAPRSKRPLVEWKAYQEVAPLPDEVETWWSRWPDANVALVLGRGTFAVDLDGGREAESLLKAQGIYFPPAPRTKTASGFHVFFSAPGPVPDRVGLLSTGGKKPQVDIRAVRIVLAPPSVPPDGPIYEWQVPLSLPFPAAPEGLLALIAQGSPKPTGIGAE